MANKNSVWRTVALIRYAGMAPLLLILLLLSYTRCFLDNWIAGQSIVAIFILLWGIGVIAVSVIGTKTGWGLLALYIVYCLNVTFLSFALRLVMLCSLIIIYVVVVILVDGTSLGATSDPSTVVYLVIFYIGEIMPVLVREHAMRRNFLKRWRTNIERLRLQDEEDRTNALLENLLPPSIVPRLRDVTSAADGNGSPLIQGAEHMPTLIADTFDNVSILWTDIKGFTKFSSSRTPLEIVSFVNSMFSTFDRVVDKHEIRKVEVLGDAFFVVGGCPIPSEDHAERCVNAALEMQLYMPVLSRFANSDLAMRIGVNSGSVVAGVVGLSDPRYHLFGSTVNYANYMESSGIPGRVQVSLRTYEILSSRQIERAQRFVDFVSDQLEIPFAERVEILSVEASYSAVPNEDSVEKKTKTWYPPLDLRILDDMIMLAMLEEPSRDSNRLNLDDDAEDGSNGRSPNSRGKVKRFANKLWTGLTDIISPEKRPKVMLSESKSPRSTNSDLAISPGTSGSSEEASSSSGNAASLASVPLFLNTLQHSDRVEVEGGDELRGLVRIWRDSTFLGWDFSVNCVQGSFIYDVATLEDPVKFGIRQNLQRKEVPHPKESSAASTPSKATPVGWHASASLELQSLFHHSDPANMFGMNGGFFSFEKRTIEVPDVGMQTTYLVSRANPPYIAELGEKLNQLERKMEHWEYTLNHDLEQFA
jgi:class 3 adenylate cyclase